MPRAMHITYTNESCCNGIGDEFLKLADSTLGEDATMGEIYRSCAAEYGRCTSAVYQDFGHAGAKKIGWFFVKRQKYTDCDTSYLQGTWVVVGEYTPAVPEHVTVAA